MKDMRLIQIVFIIYNKCITGLGDLGSESDKAQNFSSRIFCNRKKNDYASKIMHNIHRC